MERVFRSLLGAAFDRRATGLWCVAIITLVAGYGLGAVTFDSNVLNLLPQRGPTLQAFRTYLTTFGNFDRLYVAFEAPPDRVIADYAEPIDDFVDQLRALPAIAHVDSGLNDPDRDWSYLLDRQLLVLDDDGLDAALSGLQREAMPIALARARERLSVPSADMRALVQQDPLGWMMLMRDRLTGEGLAYGSMTRGEGYVSGDGRSRLIVAQPARPPQDTAFARELNATLGKMTANLSAARDLFGDALPPPGVQRAGGYRVAPEMESLIRREGIRNGIISFLAIATLVAVAFRSVRPLILISLPILVASVVTIAVYGWIRPLSTAATGSAAMLFGLGVDGTLLLYIAYLAARRRGLEARPAVLGLSAVAVSVTVGFTTTASTFLGLIPIDFPALAQLGEVVGLGILLCGLLTLTLLPGLAPRRLAPSQLARLETPWLARLVTERRRWILATAGMVTLLLGVAAPRLEVVPTVNRLEARTAGSNAEDVITRRFNLPEETVLVLGEGTDLHALLEANRRLELALARSPSVPVSAPTALLPPRSRQDTVSRRIAAVDRSPRDIDADLVRATADAGFRPNTFAAFSERLPRLIDPEQRLSLDGYRAHGLGDLIDRFVRESDGRFITVAYAFTRSADERTRVAAAAAETGILQVTGLDAVNAELSARFWPTLALGATVGTTGVLAITLVAFRSVQLALLALLPTSLGILWSAGLLALAGVELDLFSVFALLMAIGIGVDYGVHVLHHRMSHCPGGMRAALTHTAPAILLAAASTVLGFGSLIWSSYPPLQTLGLVTSLTVTTCLVASLLVMPAILGDGT